MLSVFAEFEREILRQRVKAGIAQARKNGGNHGRQRTAAQHTYKVKKMAEQGLSKAEIARRLDISRASVMRILADGNPARSLTEPKDKSLDEVRKTRDEIKQGEVLINGIG
jgi:DNA invertase Pin-like site-specific DNA recombinase